MEPIDQNRVNMHTKPWDIPLGRSVGVRRRVPKKTRRACGSNNEMNTEERERDKRRIQSKLNENRIYTFKPINIRDVM
jgi:hypothetical protein